MVSRSVVVSFFLFFAVGCGDYTIDLTGSYRLVRISGGGEFVLVRDEGGAKVIVVGPSVILYSDHGEVILGEVSPTADSRDKPGFFLVDVATNQVIDGLSEETLEVEIEGRGLERMEMVRPTRFQSLFRREVRSISTPRKTQE